MIRALTGFSTRHAWKVIAVWAVLGIALSGLSPVLFARVTGSSTGDFLPARYDSAAALRIAEDHFGLRPDATTVTVLVARADGAALTDADRRRIDAEAAGLARQRVVMPRSEDDLPSFLVTDRSQTPKVAPAMVAPDGGFELLAVELAGNAADEGVQDVYRTFRDSARERFAAAGMRTGFTGGLAEAADSADANRTAAAVGSALVVGLIVLLNVLVFRSVLAAVLPLLAVALVGGAAGGAVAGLAELTSLRLDASTPGLISVVLLGIGVDYLLFLLFRYREVLRARPDAPARTVAAEVSGRVGTAITSAALTIVAAFATLGLAGFGQFRSLGPAIAVAVLVMLLGSLTLMPALLAACGRGMFWPSRTLRREPRPGVAARLGERVARRPAAALLASVALLGVLAAGLVGIRMDYGLGGSSGTPAAATAAEISRSLPVGVSDPVTVYATADGGGAVDPAAFAGLARALGEVAGVGQVGDPVGSPDGRAVRIDVYPTADPQSTQARALVSGPLRAAVAAHSPAGAGAHVGGTAAVYADVADAVDRDLLVVFPVAAALIALILLLLLRSLLAPVALLLSVGLGFAATLGSAALVFQHLLDRPGVAFTLPLVLFLFVVALGTDYNILITDRIREEMRRPGPARAAVARAVRHTAPAVATAGLVLGGSFASLATTPGSEQIAFALTLGILLSALLLSLVVVPAVAALLGRSLWWPLRPGPERAPSVSAGTADVPAREPVR